MIRTKILNFLLFFVSCVFFSYLFYVQCFRHHYYEKRAKQQHERKFILLGSRGNIYDRNGLPIATSEQCYSVFCTPRYAVDMQKLTSGLSSISSKSRGHIRQMIDKGEFFWVEMKVDKEQLDRYLAIDDPSIGYTHDLNRRYNMPDIFASMIGRCGSDNRGIEGLEVQFDDILSGEAGFAVYQKDPAGGVFPYHNYPEKEPQPGCDLYLTVDLQLQAILHEKLKECMEKEDAQLAAGLIIEPRTGNILAMVNVGREHDSRNHIICDEFEPGSTFKLMPLTFALMNGARDTDRIDTEAGKIKVRGHMINDYRDYGVVTLKQAVAHSSNVAMVKLSREFDRERFLLLVRDFGFGEITGIEFPGEVRGRLPEARKLNDVDFATLAFGQGLTVNMLQLAMAYQTIANGGVLYKPTLVAAVMSKQTKVHKSRPLRIRRAIDESLAHRVTDILCAVVDEGSGTAAAFNGVKIAGKTGTAQKVINGSYSRTSVVATFVGYFPADDPDYLIMLMVDEPKSGYWASTIVAPVFKEVAQSVYQMNSYRYAAK
ncbi:MAG: penicillin-binding protein 2 [candidate division WOR-3 bacterium]|nr:MAG: penicillin-binding protein 2 [candidate division WOR-3 bacterium]